MMEDVKVVDSSSHCYYCRRRTSLMSICSDCIRILRGDCMCRVYRDVWLGADPSDDEHFVCCLTNCNYASSMFEIRKSRAADFVFVIDIYLDTGAWYSAYEIVRMLRTYDRPISLKQCSINSGKLLNKWEVFNDMTLQIKVNFESCPEHWDLLK